MKAGTLALIVAGTLMMAGCRVDDPAPPKNSPATTAALFAYTQIDRWHDDDKGVTCWVYQGGSGRIGSISCLPDSLLPIQLVTEDGCEAGTYRPASDGFPGDCAIPYASHERVEQSPNDCRLLHGSGIDAVYECKITTRER